MSLFCRHDWHVHANNPHEKSFRHGLFRNIDDTPFPILIPAFIAISLWFSAIAICDKLTVVENPGAYSLGIGLLCFLIFVGILVHSMANYENDPWAPTDKSCLKCGKVVFGKLNADKKEERLRKKGRAYLKRLEKKSAIRAKKIPKAVERYEYLHEIYRNSQ